MVYFLNSKVKTHTEDALQYIFDENREKIVILGYSIVSRRSPLWSIVLYLFSIFQCWLSTINYLFFHWPMLVFHRPISIFLCLMWVFQCPILVFRCTMLVFHCLMLVFHCPMMVFYCQFSFIQTRFFSFFRTVCHCTLVVLQCPMTIFSPSNIGFSLSNVCFTFSNIEFLFFSVGFPLSVFQYPN